MIPGSELKTALAALPFVLTRIKHREEDGSFSDNQGKLEVLCVECTRCVRKGRYRVRQLIEKFGRKASKMKSKEQFNGDCPKRTRRNCTISLIRPDLPSV